MLIQLQAVPNVSTPHHPRMMCARVRVCGGGLLMERSATLPQGHLYTHKVPDTGIHLNGETKIGR